MDHATLETSFEADHSAQEGRHVHDRAGRRRRSERRLHVVDQAGAVDLGELHRPTSGHVVAEVEPHVAPRLPRPDADHRDETARPGGRVLKLHVVAPLP